MAFYVLVFLCRGKCIGFSSLFHFDEVVVVLHDSDEDSRESGKERMKRDDEPAAESNKTVEKEKSD